MDYIFQCKDRQKAEWIIKQDPTICYLQDTLFRFKDTQLESEMMGKRYAIQVETKRKWDSYTSIKQNINRIQAKDFNERQKHHFKMTKGLIQYDDI